MYFDQFLLIIHIIAATMWVGGNLFIVLAYLPNALKLRSPKFISAFSSYEPFGLVGLGFSLVTGIWMAYRKGIVISTWFTFDAPMEIAISTKLIIFLLMITLIIIAKMTIVKEIKNHQVRFLPLMAAYLITLLTAGIIFVIIGTYLRYGGITWFL